ncbi:MAG: hypothetical protein LBL93_03485, partial [Ruminococcus sp.]|nr:hypothetical protein [Ruminococcus sp.]
AAPTVAASLKTVKLTAEESENLAANSLDGINKVKADEYSKQKDVTYDPYSNSVYFKRPANGEPDRVYLLYTADTFTPMAYDVPASDYAADSIDSKDIGDEKAFAKYPFEEGFLNNAAKFTVAFIEKELTSDVKTTGTAAQYGPMSKAGTLSVPALTAAPGITIDYTNGTYKGTKAGTMEYCVKKGGNWVAVVSETVWTKVTENNMPISTIDADATNVAFRNVSLYNKRSSGVKILDVPDSDLIAGDTSAIKLNFTQTMIDNKEYLLLELNTKDYAEPLTDDADTSIVGKSKTKIDPDTGKAYTATALPITYQGNTRNIIQYRVISFKETQNETFEFNGASEEKVIKNWTNVSWKPMDRGESNDIVVFDISSASFIPAVTNAADGYILQLRIAPNAKATDLNPNLTTPSQLESIYLPKRAAIGKVVANGKTAVNGDITFNFNKGEFGMQPIRTGYYELVQVELSDTEGAADYKPLGRGAADVDPTTGTGGVVYEISTDKKTWYPTLGGETPDIPSYNAATGKYDGDVVGDLFTLNNGASTDPNSGKTIIKPTTKEQKLNTIYIRKRAVDETGFGKSRIVNEYNPGEFKVGDNGYSTSAIITLTLPNIVEMTEEFQDIIRTNDVGAEAYVDGELKMTENNNENDRIVIPANTPAFEVSIEDSMTRVDDGEYTIVNKVRAPQYINSWSYVKNGVLSGTTYVASSFNTESPYMTYGTFAPAGTKFLFPNTKNSGAGGLVGDMFARMYTPANKGNPFTVDAAGKAVLSSPLNPTVQVNILPNALLSTSGATMDDFTPAKLKDKYGVDANTGKLYFDVALPEGVTAEWYKLKGKTANLGLNGDERIEYGSIDEPFAPQDTGYYCVVLMSGGGAVMLKQPLNTITVTQTHINTARTPVDPSTGG